MDYRWHYDYARLAWDAGFVFGNLHHSNLDKNKLNLFDVERVVKERDITSVEQYIPLVVHYILEDEQAEILDRNFVKIFRISQLAIEYLLFCKKYLDNTVVLLKKEMSKLKEQLNKYKQNNVEIETKLASVTPRLDVLTAVYKCEKCEKAFSTENYLNSHIKRRHNCENSTSKDSDDTVHTEIKELKERLNSTDKLLQQIHVSEPTIKTNSEQNSLIDLEEKFCSFREQVENEIIALHLEKNLYEEKYTKLFDVTQNVVKETIGTMTSDDFSFDRKERQETSLDNLKTTIEDCTRTEHLMANKLNQGKAQKLFIHNNSDNHHNGNSTNEITTSKIDEKLNLLTEDVDNKISNSMDMIKNQMHMFLEEMKRQSSNRDNDVQKESQTETPDSVVKPQAKPRTKLSITSMTQKNSDQPLKKDNTTKEEISRIVDRKCTMVVTQTLQEETESEKIENDSIFELKAPSKIQDDSSSGAESLKTSTTTKYDIIVPCQGSILKSKIRPDSSETNMVERIGNILTERFSGVKSSLFEMDTSHQKFLKAKEILSNHPNLKKKMNKTTRDRKTRKTSHENSNISQKKVPKFNRVKLSVKKTAKHEKENISDRTPTQLTVLKNRLLLDTDSDTERSQPEKIALTNKNDSEIKTNTPFSPQKEKNCEPESISMEVIPNNLITRKKVIFQSDPTSSSQNRYDQKGKYDGAADGITKLPYIIEDYSSNSDSSKL